MYKNKSNQKRGALGKGIHSLLGDVGLSDEPINKNTRAGASTQEVKEENMVLRVDPKLIDPNPEQPRKVFKEKDLKELAASIKEDGILQPLVVSKAKAGRYTLIAGERRLRASKMNHLSTVPVIFKDGAPKDLLRLALIENIQRANLNTIEEAEAYQSLIKNFGLTQELCAKKVGKERSTVTNTIRMLALPKEVQNDISEGRMSMGHGRALLSLEAKPEILRARDIVIKKRLSVRQTEQLTKNIKKNGSATAKVEPEGNPDLDYIADKLRSQLRTKVKLSGSGNRGKIEISYFSGEELERILDVISKKI